MTAQLDRLKQIYFKRMVWWRCAASIALEAQGHLIWQDDRWRLTDTGEALVDEWLIPLEHRMFPDDVPNGG
ncbi:hypothetical protein B9J07_18085 [Sinorhizobium sp. LM21]|nr:hypothetical protein B9J07_18085 [Sinorhizobium sp. LM21]